MIKRFLLAFPLVVFSGCMSSPAVTPGSPAMPAGQSAKQASSQSIDAILESAPQVTLHVLAAPSRANPALLPAAAPKFLLNFVASGPTGKKLPCFDCVNGKEAGTFGIADPDNYVLSDRIWTYIISFTSVTFTGKCKLAWAITAGSKVIDSFSGTATVGSIGVYDYWGFRNRPSYSGSATLTGKLSCTGGGPAQTATAPLVFQ
jgi:hypothetical protein